MAETKKATKRDMQRGMQAYPVEGVRRAVGRLLQRGGL
jgi:hypothetical protein